MSTARKVHQKFGHKRVKPRTTTATVITAGTLIAGQAMGAPNAFATNGSYLVSNCLDAGPGSFRQAITDANMYGGPSQIDFDSGLGCSTINISSTDLPIITENLKIIGPGADKLTVAFSHGQGTGLRLGGEGHGLSEFLISGLTFSGRGLTTESDNADFITTTIDGVDFKNVGLNFAPGYWTRVVDVQYGSSYSKVVFKNSTIENSGADSGDLTEMAIWTSGELVVDNSTFVGNVFQEGALYATVQMTVSNSTFVNNDFDAYHLGATAPFTSFGALTLFGNAFAQNVVTTQAQFLSTAVCNTTGNDFGANLFDIQPAGCVNHNLPIGVQENGGSAVIANLGSTISDSAANNGGSIRTVALLKGSPAIDYYVQNSNGVMAGYVADIDQREFTRPYGSGYDVGAFEYRNTPTTPSKPASATCTHINLGTVKFKKNSTKLTKSAKTALDKYVSSIVKSGCHTVTLNGYSAAVGKTTKATTKFRTNLSKKRAIAVQKYLESGLESHSIKVTFVVHSLGTKNPVASNKHESGRKKNRRVEVIISKLRAMN